MFNEMTEKSFDGDLMGFRKVVWSKRVDTDAVTGYEMNRRFLHSVAAMKEKRVLVVGAGTLGNEVVKDLVLAGVRNITVVDDDSIEAYNLPRSVLFRGSDISDKKSLVMARRAAELSPFDVEITGIDADITALGWGFLAGFDVILSPVDSWTIRAYLSAGASMYGITHISCGTAVLDGTMYTTITLEPAGCKACYSCMVPGDLREQEKKLSCINYKPETQAQVVSFSSVSAGFAAQLAVNVLNDNLNLAKDREGNPKAVKYILRELSMYDDTKGLINVSFMSNPDKAMCIHHSIMERIDNRTIHTISIERDKDGNTLKQTLDDIFGENDEYVIDVRGSMLFYMAFPSQGRDDEEVPGSIPAISVFEGAEITEYLQRLPDEHIYTVKCLKGLRSKEILMKLKLKG